MDYNIELLNSQTRYSCGEVSNSVLLVVQSNQLIPYIILSVNVEPLEPEIVCNEVAVTTATKAIINAPLGTVLFLLPLFSHHMTRKLLPFL